MQNITTRSIWQQPSLTPSQFSAHFLAIQTNIILSLLHTSYRLVHGLKQEYFTQTEEKQGGEGKTHSASVFETLESFETEQFFSALCTCIEPVYLSYQTTDKQTNSLSNAK